MSEGYMVYRHIFPNGKSYVGITKRDPERRYRGGKGYERQSKMWNAVKKYGWENIRHEIIAENLTLEEAKREEIENIRKYDSVENGYNITFGGGGVKTKTLLTTKATLCFNKLSEYFNDGQKASFNYMATSPFYAEFINYCIDRLDNTMSPNLYEREMAMAITTWNVVQKWILEEITR